MAIGGGGGTVDVEEYAQSAISFEAFEVSNDTMV